MMDVQNQFKGRKRPFRFLPVETWIKHVETSRVNLRRHCDSYHKQNHNSLNCMFSFIKYSSLAVDCTSFTFSTFFYLFYGLKCDVDVYVYVYVSICIRLLTYTFGGKKTVGGDVNKRALIDQFGLLSFAR